jgi:hypothetical protein
VEPAGAGGSSDELRRLVLALESAEIGRRAETNINFDISTLDADSMDRLIKTKIIPTLSRMTKDEKFLIHPKSVREF